MKRGFLWLGGASVIARVIDAVSVLVVMWFTSREQLGVATLAWSVSVFLEATNGLGIGTAILQARDVTDARLASAFWYTMGAATLVVALVAGASPWLAQWFDAPALAPMIAVSSLKLWFVSLALIPLTLLNRATDFARIAAVQTGATLGSAVLTCVLVMLGHGAWGIVIGHTSSGLITAVLANAARFYVPRGRFALDQSRDDIRFGLSVTGSSLLYHFYRNADYYLIGRFLGVGAVGVYRVAYDLAMTPIAALLGVVGRSALPVYARISDRRHELREAFVWTLKSLGILLAPVTALLWYLAEDILRLIDHGRWLEALPMLRWLLVAAVLRCLAQLIPQLFHAVRRPTLALYDSLLMTGLVLAVLGSSIAIWGPQHGAITAAWGWGIVYPIELVVLLWTARSIVDLRVGALLVAFVHPLLALLAIACVQSILPSIDDSRDSAIGSLLFKAAVILAVFGIYVTFVMRVSLRRDVFGRSGEPHV